MTGNEMQEIFGEVISEYSRATAIEDGDLVDVTETAKEAGFKFPVAITRTLYDGYIVPDPRSVPYGQSERGRLWDVLSVLNFVIRASRGSTDRVLFKVRFIMKTKQVRDIVIKSMCGPGDNAEPVITIMLRDED